MAQRSRAGFILTCTAVLVLVALSLPVTGVHAEDREEIIIQGEDRQPTKSSFEYGDDSDTGPGRMETSEAPAARSGEGVKSPGLDRELRTESSRRDTDRGTRFREEEDSGYFWITIFGVLILVAAAAG